MMAYVKTILITIKGVCPRMGFLAQRLQSSLLAHLGNASRAQLPFLLWALFMAAISVFESCHESWLREALVQTMLSLELRSWRGTKDILDAFLWTDILHGIEGKELFEECFQEPPTEVNPENIS